MLTWRAGRGHSLALVDAGDTWERIHRLVERGMTRKEIAQHVTGRPGACRLRLRHDQVTRSVTTKIESLHQDRLGFPGGAAATPPGDDDAEPAPDLRRFPIAPLLEVIAGRGMTEMALADTARIRIDRAKQIGLNPIQADRATTALGLHPDSLWPTYTDGGEP